MSSEEFTRNFSLAVRVHYYLYYLSFVYTLFVACCCNNFCAFIMASTSPELRDKRDRCNVGLVLIKCKLDKC